MDRSSPKEPASSNLPSVKDPKKRASLLKSWALAEGFDRAGIATLEPSEYGTAFDAWIDAGFQAGMEYMTRYREKRHSPASLLEGSRSALVVALHYAPLEQEEVGDHHAETLSRDSLWPRVARYARGDDYHEVMKRRLRRLGERIEEAFPGTRSRSYVDTGPLLERELGARAGLGAIGKNTNLLHRSGSWFLLGEVLLTLDLEPDEPLGDMCGDCVRCLEACPTQAFPEPYVLDAGRCISYWTIEHRGEVPSEHKGKVQDWVFGCDICQEVCPWNEFHEKRGEQTFDAEWARVPERRRALTLSGLLSLERESYTELFRKSPMKRAKLEGLRRNARLVKANAEGGSAE